MDTAQCVRLLDANNHLGNVEASYGFAEDILPDEQSEKVTAWHVVHDQV